MSKYEKMVALNKKASKQKMELAKGTIWKMLEMGEKITVPKLMAQTGLSRGFFYKNLFKVSRCRSGFLKYLVG